MDPWFIVSSDRENSNLIRTAREVNDGKPQWVIDKVREAVSHQSEPTVAALGLAFKANIDDLRESPALNIAADLADQFSGSEVLVVEPHVEELPAKLQGKANVRLVSADEAVTAADIVLLLVDHDAFAGLGEAVAGKRVIDTRGQWRAEAGASA